MLLKKAGFVYNPGNSFPLSLDISSSGLTNVYSFHVSKLKIITLHIMSVMALALFINNVTT